MTVEATRKGRTQEFPWAAALVGVPLLCVWVGVCSTSFMYLLNVVGATETTLQYAVWPFALIMLGMPLIVALMFGGLRLLSQLFQLKEFVDDLPKVIATIEKIAIATEKATEKVQAAASSAQAAAVSAQVAVNDADAVTVQAANVSAGANILVDRFFKHYELAKKKFLEAMNKLDQWPLYPRYLQSDRENAIAALLAAQILDKATADYIVATIDTERNTRRWSRSNLDQPQMDKLEQLASEARLAV